MTYECRDVITSFWRENSKLLNIWDIATKFGGTIDWTKANWRSRLDNVVNEQNAETVGASDDVWSLTLHRRCLILTRGTKSRMIPFVKHLQMIYKSFRNDFIARTLSINLHRLVLIISLWPLVRTYWFSMAYKFNLSKNSDDQILCKCFANGIIRLFVPRVTVPLCTDDLTLMSLYAMIIEIRKRQPRADALKCAIV